MLIHFFNLLVLTSIFGFTSLVLLTPLAWALLLYEQVAHKDAHLGHRASVSITALCNGIPPILLAISIVVGVEQTIHANEVAVGEWQWTLGQTLALFVSCIPVWDVSRWIYHEVTAKSTGIGKLV